MSIYINRNGQTSEPFEESVVLNQLSIGESNPDNFGCRHGARAKN